MGALNEVTRLTRRDIAASGFGSDPKAVAAFESLQDAAFDNNPAAAEAAQQAAETADGKAETAQASADTAATDAAAAGTAAGAAQTTANSALALATTKANKSTGAAWAAPIGTASRTALSAYVSPTVSNPPTQAEMQALANAVQALSQALVAVITDLRATEALKP